MPEEKQTYLLQITSATGGATVDPAAKEAEIIMVASDYPHGLFEFGAPPTVTVNEGTAEV